jgi:hypothetical protein
VASVNDLVQRVRDLLNDQPYETTSSTTTTADTVSVPDGTIWNEGDILEWQTGTIGYEQAYVVDIVANDLTTIRGYGGTTAETHASGDRIVQGPSFFGRQLQQAGYTACRGLWPYVYKTEVVPITPTGSSDPVWFNVNVAGADPVGLVRATQEYGTSPKLYLGVFGVRGGRPIEMDYRLPSSIAASGIGVRFPSGLYHPTNTINLEVQQTVTGILADNDILDTSQFPVADCIIYFMAGRVVQALEIPRVAVGTDLETSGSVGTGSRLQTGQYYTSLAKQKLEELALKYRNHYKPSTPEPRANSGWLDQ